MKNLAPFVVVAFFALTSCTPNSPEELETDLSITSNIKGTIEFLGIPSTDNLNPDPQTWTLGDKSSIQICISKNLTLNPYNLKLTLKVDESDLNAPVIYFSSDFDRKIIEGDRYRLMTTIILDGDNQVIAGQTGGKISLFNNQSTFGMGLGSELEIIIAEEEEFVIEGSAQLLNFTGFFVEDSNNLSTQSIGSFSIQIDANNILNTSLFD